MKIRSFPELCAECGLFPIAPPIGHRIAALDEPLHRNAMAINLWANARWHATGYTLTGRILTPRELHRLEATYGEQTLSYFSFANPIL